MKRSAIGPPNLVKSEGATHLPKIIVNFNFLLDSSGSCAIYERA